MDAIRQQQQPAPKVIKEKQYHSVDSTECTTLELEASASSLAFSSYDHIRYDDEQQEREDPQGEGDQPQQQQLNRDGDDMDDVENNNNKIMDADEKEDEPGGDEKEEGNEEEETRRRSSSCRDHPRVKELYQKADWWTLWIGLLSFALAVALVYIVPYDDDDSRLKLVVPQPKEWNTNPFDAWDAYNLVGIPLFLTVLGCLYLLSLYAMGKLTVKKDNDDDEKDSDNNKDKRIMAEDRSMSFYLTVIQSMRHLNNNGSEGKLVKYLCGYSVMALLATVAFWFGRNEWASEHGLGYAVFAILIGMLITNTPALAGGGDNKLSWLQLAAKDGEFFIKCSLVLLSVELDVLVTVGGPGMAVAWIGSPLAVVLGFVLGMKLFHTNDSLAMLVAVGASWCGASAISAVAPVVQARSEDVSLAISVVAFFTVIFTFVQPYVAIAIGMPDDVAGAWIGGSVDQTGNVVVSAAIISDEATEVAGIVKMVLNAAMGVLASVIACYWNARRLGDDDERKKFNLIMLWDKFPKFTLGFIITSAILTGMMQTAKGKAEEEALPAAISTVNKWWFTIAFVGIGLTTNIKKLWEKAWKSGVLQVYLLANTIDIFLALGLAYLVYNT